MSLHVIILAAGQGKRMMSDLPKVAHRAAGRSLIEWVLGAVAPLEPDSTVVVVGHGAEAVEPLLEGASAVLQDEQLGTGHATQIALAALPPMADDDTVMVLYGDMPLMTTGLLAELSSRQPGTSALMVTARFADPSGYGRVVRGAGGMVQAVVEHRDCTAEQLEIDEINAGAYSFDGGLLDSALKSIDNDNAQGELYLTDVIGILVGDGRRVEAVMAPAEEVVGINSQDQLAEAARLLHQRRAAELAEQGVWILDPSTTYIDDTASVAPGARIYPGVYLLGTTEVGADASVGPNVYAEDSVIGQGSRVWYSVLRDAEVGGSCEVGPYVSLRPGTVLAEGSKAGTFVEMKNTTVGSGSKVPHLTYLGDATVGEGSNIGAGSITANYDGIAKHRTTIGDEVSIGVDTMLVAPVTIGDKATTGAGSVITEDVSEGALALERSEQKEIPGYAERQEARKAEKKDAEG